MIVLMPAMAERTTIDYAKDCVGCMLECLLFYAGRLQGRAMYGCLKLVR